MANPLLKSKTPAELREIRDARIEASKQEPRQETPEELKAKEDAWKARWNKD